jgi:acetyl-CoA carboxylase biotin carboxyl carrier protein
MALSDDDVREILRIIDESELDELLVETDGFRLHVLRGSQSTVPSPQSSVERPQTPDPGPQISAQASNGSTIDSPMLGTFYRAEAPGAAPFVDVGANVDADTTVCLIEVMKMMNSVPAGVAGTIVEVCAENAEVVEYGQPLFRVEP